MQYIITCSNHNYHRSW